MSNLSSFEQMLSYTGSKIAHMSEEFAKHHDKLSSAELKTMTSELKKSKKTLSSYFNPDLQSEFDYKLLSSILSYINKIKRSTSKSNLETTRKTQKMNFLEALEDFQSLLRSLKKHKKEGTDTTVKKLKKRSVVKIQSIQGKSLSQIKELDNHLHLAEAKLREIKRNYQAGSSFLSADQYKDITALLKKANLYLSKTTTLHQSFTNKSKPEFNTATIKKLLNHIQFIQSTVESEIQAGSALTQANLFWYTLREFQTLVQELERLKKTRGKAVAKVDTDLLA